MILARVAQRPLPEGETDPAYLFFCPACRCAHGVWVERPCRTGASWTVTGADTDKPTIEPSLRISSEKPECHLNVTNGMLVYHEDCKHEYAGKTIPMVDF